MAIARLDDRAVIALSGPEARGFLQGLITNDVERLKPGVGLYAALLTPQGKILYDFFVVEGDGAILLDVHADTAAALAKRLTFYRLRAKVEIQLRDQLAVLASWDGEQTKYAINYADPRLTQMGMRSIGAKAEMPSDVFSTEAYHKRRKALGVPEAQDFGQDKIFALDADLDELHAVDFEKGCYVGQEQTARMKHRGTARKRLMPVTGASAEGNVTAGGVILGEMMSSDFALLRLDRLEENAGTPLQVEGKSVTLGKPDWLFPAS
jgi:folate-binding protein YgfZ